MTSVSTIKPSGPNGEEKVRTSRMFGAREGVRLQSGPALLRGDRGCPGRCGRDGGRSSTHTERRHPRATADGAHGALVVIRLKRILQYGHGCTDDLSRLLLQPPEFFDPIGSPVLYLLVSPSHLEHSLGSFNLLKSSR